MNLQEMIDEATERSIEKLRSQEYSKEDAVIDACQNVMTESGYNVNSNWPDELYQELKSQVMENIDDGEWEYELHFSPEANHGDWFLDADPCPRCDSGVLSVTIAHGGQFVMSGRDVKEEIGGTDRHLFHMDDGPHMPRVEYAYCSSCDNELVDNRTKDDYAQVSRDTLVTAFEELNRLIEETEDEEPDPLTDMIFRARDELDTALVEQIDHTAHWD